MSIINFRETIAKIVSDSKVLQSVFREPKLWSDLACKMRARAYTNYVEGEENMEPYYDYENQYDKAVPEEHACSGCMYCLGLSWRDFM